MAVVRVVGIEVISMPALLARLAPRQRNARTPCSVTPNE
jgi:hypothetical protein